MKKTFCVSCFFCKVKCQSKDRRLEYTCTCLYTREDFFSFIYLISAIFLWIFPPECYRTGQIRSKQTFWKGVQKFSATFHWFYFFLIFYLESSLIYNIWLSYPFSCWNFNCYPLIFGKVFGQFEVSFTLLLYNLWMGVCIMRN